ncbi:MAG: asparagine synthase (glutamine-hydrolyzing) [Proteobacteria bacterium]|nr:MAG: asparagine synthase (glutamine-hydrolyzing) [Pseudomonadota bacterium]
MCGITGAFGYGRSGPGIDEATLWRMTDAMAHRGPDGRAIHLDPERRLGLGHRRLSIIDLAAGHQPMANDDGSLWIVFNGEIYNHVAIRERLEAKGVRFTTRCDTEAILRLYEERGEDCVHELLGMFAFAIWDAKQGRLFLARDRIGIKPLYWCDTGGELLFASELAALFQHPSVPRKMDLESFYHHLSFMSTPVPRTMFEGVSKLGPGHRMIADRSGVRIERWWDALDAPRLAPADWADEDAVARTILAKLESAVRDRMMSDVPFGVFLSGGIDSSVCTALMARCSDLPINTFTVGYSGAGTEHLNELHHARRIAEQYGTNHREVIIGHREVLDYLPRLLDHQDEPIADPVCVPLYYVSKLAADAGIKVIQVGEGSDELFMGYPPFLQTAHFHDRVTRPLSQLPRGARAALYGVAGPVLRAIGRRAGEWEELLHRSVDMHPFLGGAIPLTDREKQRVVPGRPPGVASWDVVRAFHDEMDRRWPDADCVQHMSYVELRQRLPELLLGRVDKITMSVSLEARVPFLDHRLVEYALRLPQAAKIRGGHTKAILKKAVAGLIPDDLIHRRKQGFPAPMSQWVFEQEFGRHLRDTVLHSALVRDGLLDGAAVGAYVDAHFSRRRDHGALLWTFFNLTLWHRRWIEQQPI